MEKTKHYRLHSWRRHKPVLDRVTDCESTHFRVETWLAARVATQPYSLHSIIIRNRHAIISPSATSQPARARLDLMRESVWYWSRNASFQSDCFRAGASLEVPDFSGQSEVSVGQTQRNKLEAENSFWTVMHCKHLQQQTLTKGKTSNLKTKINAPLKCTQSGDPPYVLVLLVFAPSTAASANQPFRACARKHQRSIWILALRRGNRPSHSSLSRRRRCSSTGTKRKTPRSGTGKHRGSY